MRWRFFWAGAVCLWLSTELSAQEAQLKIEGEIIHGPSQDAERAAWRSEMQRWREAERARLNYRGDEYARPELLWTQRSFIQPQMMVEERYFYDPVAGHYTVDRCLDDLAKRYGGIDSVLLWPVYPNIGIDNRNQHDLLRDLPGGLAGVRQMVADFHRRQVRVLFPVMPWDAGTRPEGVPLWTAAAQLMKEIGADGLNGDTMGGMGRDFRQASDLTGHVLALEPENAMADQAVLAWNNLSWGYWKYQPIPVVSKYKWIEPRHMVNVCERWAKNRTDGMQAAFFNGVGYESWENVWGIWNQFTPRDAEALRRIATIERAVADLLVSPAWEPHVPTLQPGVFASRFPGIGQTVWMLVNRGDKDLAGGQIVVAHQPREKYYDLWHGVELKPEIDGQSARLSFELESHGYGAVLAVEAAQAPASIRTLLTTMAGLAATRFSSLSVEWKCLPQKIVEIAPTKPVSETPEGMIRMPAGKFHFKVAGVEIEGGNGPGVDVQYPWEDLPRRQHETDLDLKAFFIDRYPVSNAQFKKFIAASRYQPKDSHNFLKDWKDGNYPPGWEKKPVTWISLEDARAYASWAGKRLPHEWEWQYAAQGTDGRLYPWGPQPDDTALPKPEDGHDLRGPTDVDAFPKGASPFGVMDLVGNVWQWTDEYQDEHTRAAIVRGGGYYRPKGSNWYFPRNTKLGEHGKYLLMAPSKDRSGCIGFRCVVDCE